MRIKKNKNKQVAEVQQTVEMRQDVETQWAAEKKQAVKKVRAAGKNRVSKKKQAIEENGDSEKKQVIEENIDSEKKQVIEENGDLGKEQVIEENGGSEKKQASKRKKTSEKKTISGRKLISLKWIKPQNKGGSKRKKIVWKRPKGAANENDVKTGKKEKIAFYQSIRTKLIAGFAVPVILLIVLGIISYKQASDAILNNYKSAMVNTIEKASDYYNLLIKTVEIESNKLAQNSTLKYYYKGSISDDELEEANQLQNLIRDIMLSTQADPSIQNVHVYGAEGLISVSSAKKGTPMSYKDYMDTAEGAEMLDKKGYSVLSGYHATYDESSNLKSDAYAVTVRRNVTDRALKVNGMVILDVTMDAIKEPLKNVDLEEGSLCAFVTPDGREVTKDGGIERTFLDMEIYQRFMESGEDTLTEAGSYEGTEYQYIFSRVGETDFAVCTMVPQAKILEQVKVIKNITVLIVVVAIVLSTTIAVILSSGVDSAVRGLSKPLRAAAKGDLTEKIKVRSKDEFRILSNNVAYMMANMKGFIRKTNDVSGRVLESASYVAHTTGRLVISADNIREIVDSVEEGVTRQNLDIENCIVKMDELSHKIGGVNEDTVQAEAYANKTKKTVEKGIDTVKTLNEKTTQTSEITNTVISEIEGLVMETKAINSITDAINEIATQTNLLSLNASIEAARVGAAGRGFQVVATEIRKLADESLSAVTKIHEIIEKIEVKTNKTIEISKQAKEMVDTQGEALQDTVNSFGEISHGVRGLTNRIAKISQTMNDMEGAKDETLQAISSISMVSQETATAAEEVKIAAATQMDSIQNLSDAANKLNLESEKLTQAIATYKI